MSHKVETSSHVSPLQGRCNFGVLGICPFLRGLAGGRGGRADSDGLSSWLAGFLLALLIKCELEMLVFVMLIVV